MSPATAITTTAPISDITSCSRNALPVLRSILSCWARKPPTSAPISPAISHSSARPPSAMRSRPATQPATRPTMIQATTARACAFIVRPLPRGCLIRPERMTPPRLPPIARRRDWPALGSRNGDVGATDAPADGARDSANPEQEHDRQQPRSDPRDEGQERHDDRADDQEKQRAGDPDAAAGTHEDAP